jgi:hypothetical protein
MLVVHFDRRRPRYRWSLHWRPTTILGTILTTAGTVATGGSLGGDIIGGISGGVNSSQPWNEQIPIGSIGGSLNTGGTFGSGNTNPFIFSLDPAQSQSQSWFQQTFGWLWTPV